MHLDVRNESHGVHIAAYPRGASRLLGPLEQEFETCLRRAGLTQREALLLMRRSGFDGDDARTLDECSRLCGLSRERVRQVVMAAENVIRRHYSLRPRLYLPCFAWAVICLETQASYSGIDSSSVGDFLVSLELSIAPITGHSFLHALSLLSIPSLLYIEPDHEQGHNVHILRCDDGPMLTPAVSDAWATGYDAFQDVRST